MLKVDSIFPVWRVSSARIKLTDLSTLMARNVISCVIGEGHVMQQDDVQDMSCMMQIQDMSCMIKVKYMSCRMKVQDMSYFEGEGDDMYFRPRIKNAGLMSCLNMIFHLQVAYWRRYEIHSGLYCLSFTRNSSQVA
jgi:hypothetical protein